MEERLKHLFDGDRNWRIRCLTRQKLVVVVGVFVLSALLGLISVTERRLAAEEPKKRSSQDRPAAVPAQNAEAMQAVERGSGRISGQVLFDKDGGVAANAQVILLQPPPNAQEAYSGPVLPTIEATADTKGKFSFHSLPPGRYRVWANLGKQSSRKQKMQGVDIQLTEGADTRDAVELRLHDSLTITVKVIDAATSVPIPDATIHLRYGDLPGVFHAKGTNSVIVQPLTPEDWFVEAWAEGHAKDSQWVNLESGNDREIGFKLSPGGSLEGVVRDPDGMPVQGATLIVPSTKARNREQRTIAISDAKGRYRLENLSLSEETHVYISKVGLEEQEQSVRVTKTLQTLDITMIEPRDDGGVIFGVVRDRNGRPIEGAELTTPGGRPFIERKTTTDKAGRFKLDDCRPEGTRFEITGFEVIVRAKGCALRLFAVEPGSAKNPESYDFDLEPGHSIVGRVTDDKGNGLDDVKITYGDGERSFSLGGIGRTDKDGRFQFDTLPERCPFSFEKSGFSEVVRQELDIDGKDEVTIKMYPVAVILGKVVDGDTGAAIRSFNVRLGLSQQRGPDDPNGNLDSKRTSKVVHSDTGQFEISGLVHRLPLQVKVEAKGYEPKIVGRVNAIREDEAKEVVFKINRLDPAKLRKYGVQLLDSKLAPIEGIQLRLIVVGKRDEADLARYRFDWDMLRNSTTANRPDLLRFLKGVTDREGRFEFTDVPRDEYTELAWWGGRVASGFESALETRSNAENVAIAVPDPARIRGRIDRQRYSKITSITVDPQDETLERKSLHLEEDQQEYMIDNLAAGTYRVTLMGKPVRVGGQVAGRFTSSPVATVTITLEEGDVIEVDFTD